MTLRDQIRQKQFERQAEGYLELGLPQRALESLAKIAEPGGLSPGGLYLQGEALRAMERYEDALTPLERVASDMPGDLHVCLAWGGATSGPAGSTGRCSRWSGP